MKLLFKQRLFSWFDNYDIYNETGEVVYTVKGQLSWGHCLKIFDANKKEIGIIKERLFTILPKFEMYSGEQYIGSISKEFALFKPKYNIDCNNWHVEGNFFEWDYNILDSSKQIIATISKKVLSLTDTYEIDILNPKDALYALMLVLAIDAEKCSRND